MKLRFTGQALTLAAAMIFGVSACSSTTTSTKSTDMMDKDSKKMETTRATDNGDTMMKDKNGSTMNKNGRMTDSNGMKMDKHENMDSTGRKMDSDGMNKNGATMNGDAKMAGQMKAGNSATPEARNRRAEMRELLMKSTAVATLAGAAGSKIEGRVYFTKEGDGVRVVANIHGLTPGEHGFHLHQNGDCSSPDFKSAGDHFNPLAKTHGSADPREHHMGDLGNLTADEKGNAHYDELIAGLSMDGDTSIMGKGVVIHATIDDLKTQPSGNSGARIACGVVTDSAEMKQKMQQRMNANRTTDGSAKPGEASVKSSKSMTK
ncbi:hypothetical protein BH09SUM1_BH09SUM1_23520 [soil metagenome]